MGVLDFFVSKRVGTRLYVGARSARNLCKPDPSELEFVGSSLLVVDVDVIGRAANAWLTSSSSMSSIDRDIDEEIASLQLVINDLETEISAMQRHFDGELRLTGNRLHNAVSVPPLDSHFARRFAE